MRIHRGAQSPLIHPRSVPLSWGLTYSREQALLLPYRTSPAKIRRVKHCAALSLVMSCYGKSIGKKNHAQSMMKKGMCIPMGRTVSL